MKNIGDWRFAIHNMSNSNFHHHKFLSTPFLPQHMIFQGNSRFSMMWIILRHEEAPESSIHFLWDKGVCWGIISWATTRCINFPVCSLQCKEVTLTQNKCNLFETGFPPGLARNHTTTPRGKNYQCSKVQKYINYDTCKKRNDNVLLVIIVIKIITAKRRLKNKYISHQHWMKGENKKERGDQLHNEWY